MNEAYSFLITEAGTLMRRSRDQVHDLAHVGRVVHYAKNIARRMHTTDTETEAVLMVAWWHDVARTITKKPSLVWMSFIDDMVSAFMLWRATRRYKNVSPTVYLAAKLILCKSLGTGALFTKLFLPKELRHLVDIVKDADTLDVLNQKRLEQAMSLAASSTMYRLAYKQSVRWFISSAKLSMRTEAAREYLEDMLRALMAWMKKQVIFLWHVEQFGRAWTEQIMRRCQELLRELEYARATI